MTSFNSALAQGIAVPPSPQIRPGWDEPLMIRKVPDCKPRPAYLAHPRLRRASAVSHYAGAAAIEAIGPNHCSSKRLGLVLCLQAGCVQYSDRFFSETLSDPATASPLLFPETVLAAPASHIAAVLKNVTVTQTLVGDPASFLQCLVLGAEWLLAGEVDQCIVIGAEESSWIVSDAFRFWDRQLVASSGTGALCLTLDPAASIGVALDRVTDAHSFTATQSRLKAAAQMRSQLSASAPDRLLCDGLQNLHQTDAPERTAWSDWSGPRISPKLILGEGLCAAAAWQCLAACNAIASGHCASAIASVVGCNQQAIGAEFIHSSP
jgi:hypothetical protein